MESSQAPGLIVRLFGYPHIELDGAPASIERHKAIALLAYLAVSGQRVGRETLAAFFWPDYEEAQASAYLRHTLWELRRALGEGCLGVDQEAVALAPGGNLWVDVTRFQELVAGEADRLQRLEEAIALYRGDFLAGFTLRDSPDFDDWQSIQAEALRRRLAKALAALVEARTIRGEYEQAIAEARRWLAMDLLDEAPHRALMQIYAWSGQRSAAIRQYEACAGRLQSELEAEPEPATMALYQEICAGRISERKVEALSPAPEALHRTRLPLPVDPTPFLGREAEMAEIAHLLAEPGCRLLTLTGPGGIGKTRLAIEAARTQTGSFADGVAFVPLAAHSSGDALVGAVAEQLQLVLCRAGAREPSPAKVRQQLLEHLRRQELLLVLDNAEHLVVAIAGLLAELLPTAQHLKLLVTSRERLNLREEWVLEVHGLGYPGPGRTGNLADYPAVQLFLKAAGRARVGLQLEPADWLAVTQICQSLEGMPLGIELAAPWVRVLSCPEIAAEIEGNRDFLASSQRGAPERHRSLRAVFEHSWRLLAGPEREVFARLAVFQGGFTREAAIEVAGATLADLSALVDKSLLRREASGRYGLHPVLKQYAADKLADSAGAGQETRAGHAAYYLDLLHTVGEGLKGREQQAAMDRLLEEAGNLHLAWEHTLAVGDWERARRSLPAWILFSEMGPRRREGGEAIRAAIAGARAAVAREGPNPTLNALLGLLLAAWRFFAMGLDPGVLPGPLAEESLTLARTLPACPEKAMILLLNCIGPALPTAEQAQAIAQESREVFASLGDRWGMALARLVWADCANWGAKDPAVAWPAYQDARADFQAMGNRWGEALCLIGLTYIALNEKRYVEALALGREGLAVYRELGNPWRIIETLSLINQAAYDNGDYATIRGCLEETLASLVDLGQRAGAGSALIALGDVAGKQGDLAGARQYLERALATYRELDDREGMEKAARGLAELAGDDSSPGLTSPAS